MKKYLQKERKENRMKVKRWLVILTAALFALAFAACDNTSSDNNKKGSGGNNNAIHGKIIQLDGGNASTGDAGDAGNFNVDWIGTGGIHIKRQGSVDTSFNVPQYSDPLNLGDEGWVVDADYTVTSYDSALNVAIVEGEYFLLDNEFTSRLYHRVTGLDVVVTGIRIDRGVTLTLGLNVDSTGSMICLDEAAVGLINDLEIRGTLTVLDVTTGANCVASPEQRHGADAIARDSGALYVAANRVYISDTGLVDTMGVDAAAASNGRGGDGGHIYVSATGIYSLGNLLGGGGNGDGTGVGGDAAVQGQDIFVVELSSYGALINKGDLDATGGNGSIGGGGGDAKITGSLLIWNTGDLIADGGDGTTGLGGDAGDCVIRSGYGAVKNSGILSADGGDGGAGGGSGGAVTIVSGRDDVINSGALLSNGGDALTAGNGGFADNLSIISYGGGVKNTGRVLGEGGVGIGAGSLGGYGGDAYFYVNTSGTLWVGGKVIPGNIVIANDILLNGGDGALGGGLAGSLIAGSDGYVNYGIDSWDASLQLIGFDIVEANGGDGLDGGDGGDTTLYTLASYLYTYDDNTDYAYVPFEGPGPIINNVPFELNGGDGSAGDGGSGGNAKWTMDGAIIDEKRSFLVNNARVDALGGDGTVNGGVGGGTWFDGFVRCENHGAIDIRGGDGTAVGSNGGNGGFWIVLNSLNNILNTSPLTTNGGDGDAAGGFGGRIYMEAGGRSNSSANLTCSGGDGGTTGGNGGLISVFSLHGKSKIKGTLDVSGGAPDGLVGILFYDWIMVTPADGTITY